jgi:hypothetical protein
MRIPENTKKNLRIEDFERKITPTSKHPKSESYFELPKTKKELEPLYDSVYTVQNTTLTLQHGINHPDIYKSSNSSDAKKNSNLVRTKHGIVADKNNCSIRLHHITGHLNTIADSLSRPTQVVAEKNAKILAKQPHTP